MRALARDAHDGRNATLEGRGRGNLRCEVKAIATARLEGKACRGHGDLSEAGDGEARGLGLVHGSVGEPTHYRFARKAPAALARAAAPVLT